MDASDFPVHCGLPCGGTPCTLCSGPTSKQRKWCNNLVRLCPRSTSQKGFFVSKTPKNHVFFWGGGAPFLGRGSKGPTSKAPMFPRVGTPKVVLVAVWCGVSGFTYIGRHNISVGVTFPRSMLQRKLSPGPAGFSWKKVWSATSHESFWRREATRIRNGQSTVGGPKWTKMDLFRPEWTKMDHFGPFWSREC